MTVAELIEKLSKLDPALEVATGFPVVWQGPAEEYQESLCLTHDVKHLQLNWDTWMGRNFVLIEVYPQVSLA